MTRLASVWLGTADHCLTVSFIRILSEVINLLPPAFTFRQLRFSQSKVPLVAQLMVASGKDIA